MFEALRFLLLAEALGLIGLPLAASALSRLPGRGVGFAKPLGFLLALWLVWMMGSLGVPYGLGLIAGVLLALAVLALLSLRRQLRRTADPEPDPHRGTLLLWSEGVFVVAFAVMALLAAYSPDVWGTEKPMDMAIVNALNASSSFPPHDPWLAGADFDGYYYGGHLLAALFIRVTAVEPTVGYNLALALTYALAATAVFSLGASLAAAAGRAAVRTGLTALALCLVLGNLAAARNLIDHDGPLREYPWFDASRVIPETINEFPLFSWTLGDLHAHVVAVAFTFLALAFAIQLLLGGLPLRSVLTGGVATGMLYVTNSWSYPVVAGLIVLATVVRATEPAAEGERRRRAVAGAGLIAASVVAILPFLVTFDPPARGFGFVDARRGFLDFMSDFALLYGLLLWLVAAAIYGAVRASAHPVRNLLWALGILAFAGAALTSKDLAGFAVLAALAAVALGRLFGRDVTAPERCVWLLIAGGLTCLAIPEIVYVRDEFDNSALKRMNTVFKFGYQGWLLLAVAGAACIPWSRVWLPRPLRGLWLAGAALLAVAALAFPIAGTYARKGGFAQSPHLDGMRWLEPGDVAAIEWLRDNADGDAVILETAGEDYSAFGHARISTYTGRAAVVGWAGHVLQWGNDAAGRREDVATTYETVSESEAAALLERHGVDYVVIGRLERADHGDAGMEKWPALGTRVFERDGTAVWRVSP